MRIDVILKIEAGTVTGFGVNLSVLIDEKKYDVIRWDTSHGFLHKHEFWRTHRTIKDRKYDNIPLDVVFKEVYDDIRKNKEKYVKRLIECMKK